MRILLASPELDHSDPAQWTKVMYRTFTILGHEVRIKVLQNDLPLGYMNHDNKPYDFALIQKPHLPAHINARVKLPIDPMVGIFPVDLAIIMKEHGSTIAKKLQDHDSIQYAYFLLRKYEHILSLPRN